jgi:hypothetical protein
MTVTESLNKLVNGLSNGTTNGQSNGTTNGQSNGTSYGHSNGMTNGHTNGHTSVHMSVHTDNHTNGHANGHANGQTNGHSNGHSNDHSTGVSQRPNETPVAICGMAMRLPGGIRNEKDLYEFLYNKRDARSVVGEDRYNSDGYYSPHGQSGTINTKQGYFLKDLDYSKLDLSMFSFSAAEAEQLDPNHRLVLEVVREAFESAGETGWRTKNIGTYSGLFTEDWQEMAHVDTQDYNAHRVLGGTDFALPNRIAYEYDLKGPR